MKRKTSLVAMLLMTVGLSWVSFATAVPTLAEESDQELLTFLWEEEKMARDLYQSLAKKWNLRPLDNIARAEQQHMNRVSALMKQKGMTIPVEAKSGHFTSLEIQRFYRDWEAIGLQSATDALRIGATVEDRDLFDLERIAKTTQDPDIKALCETLRRGSAQHMRAFARNLSNRGVTYRPKYISQATLDAILRGGD